MEEQNYQSYAKTMITITWGFIIALILFFFYYSKDDNKGSVQLKPGEIIIKADSQHHFHMKGRINSETVSFMLDTGATIVAVPKAIATKLQLVSYYPMQVETASGTVEGFLTRIPLLQLAEFNFHDVKGIIMEGGDEQEVLLGMNILSKFEWTQKNDTLTLKSLAQ